MNLKSILISGCGFLLLGLGIIGVFVPILPTTPLVLAASACFSNNPRVRSWILKNRYFREHLLNYKNRTGLTKSTVIRSLIFLWVTMFLSMLTVRESWCSVLLTVIGSAVTLHILWMAKPSEKRAISRQVNFSQNADQ